LFALTAGSASAQGIDIPRLASEPTLADFAGMRPATPLASNMRKVDNFTQRQPNDGQSATQATEVYLGYDNDNLYAVFLAFDAQPNQIRANLSSRENIDGDDSVTLIVDTFNDQRSGYAFQTTPLGIQWDARWTEGDSGFDTSFEAVWDSEGELTEQGYIVRMSVPLRSLRFADSAEQTWRIQLGRQIPRLNESTFWPPYSIAIDGRLNQAATLSGIRDVSPGNNYLLIPYVFARSIDSLDRRAQGGPAFVKDTELELGLDAKFVFNDSFVLDLALNPDFSQVESDEPQVTVNERFEVQFPERRPFFVENADFFATDATLVFTRRIVDPEGGLRFTGRSGPWGFGTMLVNDAAPGENRPQGDPLRGEKATIGVVRAFRDISDQSRVGVLVTDRELADGYNRVASLDGRFRINPNWTTQLQLVGTETEPVGGGQSITGVQRNILVDHNSRNISSHTHWIETNRDFRTQLGFQNRFFRADTSGVHNRVVLNFFPENETINRWNTILFSVYLEDMDGTRIYAQNNPGVGIVFDTSSFNAGVSQITEVLRPQDFNGLPTTTAYDYDTWNLSYENNMLSSLDFEVSFQSGTSLNLVPPAGALPFVADSQRFDFEMLWRPLDRLRVSNTYLLSELETSNNVQIFTNEIIRSSWNYQFSREMSLRFIAQYEETDAGVATRLEDGKNFNVDLLLRYVINPWSALYLGYNSNSSNFEIVDVEGERELVLSNDLKRDGDQFFVKFSYLFQR
tara:strand:- start:548 stop:2770 length:2223 start_codon:yes stop_codon:yes gene_type:complete